MWTCQSWRSAVRPTWATGAKCRTMPSIQATMTGLSANQMVHLSPNVPTTAGGMPLHAVTTPPHVSLSSRPGPGGKHSPWCNGQRLTEFQRLSQSLARGLCSWSMCGLSSVYTTGGFQIPLSFKCCQNSWFLLVTVPMSGLLETRRQEVQEAMCPRWSATTCNPKPAGFESSFAVNLTVFTFTHWHVLASWLLIGFRWLLIYMESWRQMWEIVIHGFSSHHMKVRLQHQFRAARSATSSFGVWADRLSLQCFLQVDKKQSSQARINGQRVFCQTSTINMSC